MKKTALDKVKIAFGDKVRLLRKSKGYSQEDFAFECDLHRTYIGAIERGERNVSLENIYKISKSLGVDMAELVKGIDNYK